MMNNEQSKGKLFRHPPKCPTCEEPLTLIYGKEEYQISYRDGTWHKDDGPSRLCCGKCYAALDDADVEDIMREVGLL